MPAITNQNIRALGQQDVTSVTLDGATDTFTYGNGVNMQYLVLRNTTAGQVTGSFIGDGAPSTVSCKTAGELTLTAEAFDIAAGAEGWFYLNPIATKLAGTVTITSGTGLEASLVSV